MMPETRQIAETLPDGWLYTKWAAWQRYPKSLQSRIIGCICCLFVLTLLFAQPLTTLTQYVAGNELHSHVLLVPFITGYLLITERRQAVVCRTSYLGTAVMSSIGGAALSAAFAWEGAVSLNDELALLTLAFICLVIACGFLFLGSEWIAAAAFPVGFLIFMVPLPDQIVKWLEHGSMLASADAAALYFKLTGTPMMREGTVFALPGIVLQVAPECSGIRSSWVLFITGLFASHACLKTQWRRAVLIAFIIPLGILRNGFRILVIGLLSVYVGPEMVDSPIHHRGGPLFFVLSLIPLFLLLAWLRRQERRLNLPA